MKSSASTLIFQENFSTRRCIVLMAVVGGGELHVLLVHHLHLCPGLMTFIVMVRFFLIIFGLSAISFFFVVIMRLTNESLYILYYSLFYVDSKVSLNAF